MPLVNSLLDRSVTYDRKCRVSRGENMGRERLYVGTSSDVPLASFVVVRVKNKDKLMYDKDIEEVFVSDGSQASLFIGWGVARKLSDEGDAMMVFNPNEVVIFPEENEHNGEAE